MGEFNCKSKIYPDGTVITTYCNQPIFTMYKPPKPQITVFDKDYSVYLNGFGHSGLALSPMPDPYISVDEDTGEMLLGTFSTSDMDLLHEENKPKKRSDNVKRAMDKIHDLVLLNEWSYFFTGTLNDEKFDPTSAKSALQPLQSWLKNAVNRYGLKYVLIAEYQPKSGRIHFHGFINDVLKVVDSGRRLYRAPTDRRKKMYDFDYFKRNGLNPDDYQTVYNVPQWGFGFTTAIKTYNGSQGCARYITKYITKESKAIFGRYYWSSRNLLRQPDESYENVDFDSLSMNKYSVPRTKLALKYYTFFPDENGFFWEEAANNSQGILDDLSDFEEITDNLDDFETM